MKPYSPVITCEHAGNDIPSAFQPYFKEAGEVLTSHRGWDIGALSVAKELAQQLQAPLFYETSSRLLIEMNRSIENPVLFSAYTSSLEEAVKLQLIEEYYLPYRNRVIAALQEIVDQQQCALHLSIHTFTPMLNQQVRTTDIGLLFDPERSIEVKFCKILQKYLHKNLANMQVDFNLPYQGTEDGFTTFLRKYFPAESYVGIEIEINQKYAKSNDISGITRTLFEGVRNFYQ